MKPNINFFPLCQFTEKNFPSSFFIPHTLLTIQGRCKWFNPVQKTDDEFDEEEDDEDEEKEQPDELEPETGPSLLQAVSEDASESQYYVIVMISSAIRLGEHIIAFFLCL